MKAALPSGDMKSADIADIICGRDDRFLLIVGPCSAHDTKAVLEYAARLARLADDVADKIVVAARVYTAKPRSATLGYMGLVHEVDGLFKARKLHLDVSQIGLATADELLYPSLLPYFDDVVSYFSIGARSVENQEHKLVASGVDVPVGIKNPLSGCLDTLRAAVAAVKASHDFIFRDGFVRTAGNAFAHGVLRGGIAPNYKQAQFLDIPLIIDTNHGNSGKNHLAQIDVAMDVMGLRKDNMQIKGLMIESFIEGGAQDVDGGIFGKSITDPCLSWDDTRELVLRIADML